MYTSNVAAVTIVHKLASLSFTPCIVCVYRSLNMLAPVVWLGKNVCSCLW